VTRVGRKFGGIELRLPRVSKNARPEAAAYMFSL
jgi:hypothetical protein